MRPKQKLVVFYELSDARATDCMILGMLNYHTVADQTLLKP